MIEQSHQPPSQPARRCNLCRGALRLKTYVKQQQTPNSPVTGTVFLCMTCDLSPAAPVAIPPHLEPS